MARVACRLAVTAVSERRAPAASPAGTVRSRGAGRRHARAKQQTPLQTRPRGGFIVRPPPLPARHAVKFKRRKEKRKKREEAAAAAAAVENKPLRGALLLSLLQFSITRTSRPPPFYPETKGDPKHAVTPPFLFDTSRGTRRRTCVCFCLFFVFSLFLLFFSDNKIKWSPCDARGTAPFAWQRSNRL